MVTRTSRVPAAAFAAMLMVIGRLVAVPPDLIAAVTPFPLKSTDVTPARAVPVIVAGNELPGSPENGEMPLMRGGAGFTVKPLKLFDKGLPLEMSESLQPLVLLRG